MQQNRTKMLAGVYPQSAKELVYEHDFTETPKTLTNEYSDEYLNWPEDAFVPNEGEILLLSAFRVKLVMTNFRMMFELVDMSFAEDAPQYIKDFFVVQYGSVLKVQCLDVVTQARASTVSSTATQPVVISTRDGRVFTLLFTQPKTEAQETTQAETFRQLVSNHSFVPEGEDKHFNFGGLPLTPTFAYRLEAGGVVSTAWRAGTDIRSQLLSQGLDLDANQGKYKVIDNTEFKISFTYPPYFVVPAGLTEAEMESCMSFRSKKRLPALTYFHKENGTSIWRCAQPLSGLRNRIENGDVRMLTEIGLLSTQDQHVTIFDARPKTSAQGNRLRGGGYEDASYYPNMTVTFCGIHNIHAVRNCHKAIEALASTPHVLECIDKYGPAVEKSEYMQILSDILRGANGVVACLQSGSNALVRCSDGWDRTGQLCALAQILLHPRYRTIRGFIDLVEKDWLSFGHKFSERTGVFNGKASDPEKSPIFVQFLDCVRQILIQFPE